MTHADRTAEGRATRGTAARTATLEHGVNTAPVLSLDDILCVIVTFNSAAHIENCLAAALVAGLPHIIVWDNASVDDTTSVIASLDLRIQIEASKENLGFGRAVNAAVRAARWQGSVLTLNPDCVLTPEALTSMVAVMNATEHAGVVSPAMQYPDGRRAIAAGASPMLSKELLARTHIDDLVSRRSRNRLVETASRLGVGRGMRDYLLSAESNQVREFDWVSGFCMLIRAAAWHATGGFDERFFLYFEDVALCASLRARGWLVFSDGRVTAVHDESASTRTGGKGAHYRAAMWAYFRLYGTPLQKRVERARRLR